MKILINYADKRFKAAQKYCSKTGIRKGKMDKVIEYGPENIGKEFIEKNKSWFGKGGMVGKVGLWRPLIINDALNQAEFGDYILYCDSGVFFVHQVDCLIDLLNQSKRSIMFFELPYIERQWTKRDVFKYFDCEDEHIVNSNQRLSTIILIQKSDESISFFTEYYQAAIKAPYLFTDEDNRLGCGNYDDFVTHRHNQSVLSVLSKQYGYEAYRDPTEYGTNVNLYTPNTRDIIFRPHKYTNSIYPQIFVQHRHGKVTFRILITGYLRRIIPIALYWKIRLVYFYFFNKEFYRKIIENDTQVK